MSSTAATVTGSTPHASWWARAGTWLLNIGRSIKNGLADVVGAEPKIAAAVAALAPNIEAVSNLIVPGSGSFEQHLLNVYGYVAKAVADAGGAVDSVSITTPAGSLDLDTQLVNDIKNFVPQVQSFLHPAASAAPAPAGASVAQAPAKAA